MTHVNQNSLSPGTALVGVFVVSLSFPFSLTLYHFWFHHRRAYHRMTLIKPNSCCEICQLTLTQPCLTTSRNIFIQASFTGVRLVHFFCVSGMKRFEMQGFCRQVKPSRGQWWLSGVAWLALQAELDVIKATRRGFHKLQVKWVLLLYQRWRRKVKFHNILCCNLLHFCIYCPDIVLNSWSMFCIWEAYEYWLVSKHVLFAIPKSNFILEDM